ncbi:hypothetical protein SeLEV6574_g04095 [Synchytrium endobioticum]|uniref:Uncharacterized protein n=1 Tax=Synchytrium endobioticum TaxID=286115 RepID=A0A507D0Z0_9FUNG|nr:hypothetical protein SeLEV6574_g04095 [Synchytrium endobioticum]
MSQTLAANSRASSAGAPSAAPTEEDFDSMIKRLPTSVIRELAFISSQKVPSCVDELLQLLPIAAIKAGVPQILADFNLTPAPDVSKSASAIPPPSNNNNTEVDVASRFLDKLLTDDILISSQPQSNINPSEQTKTPQLNAQERNINSRYHDTNSNAPSAAPSPLYKPPALSGSYHIIQQQDQRLRYEDDRYSHVHANADRNTTTAYYATSSRSGTPPEANLTAPRRAEISHNSNYNAASLLSTHYGAAFPALSSSTTSSANSSPANTPTLYSSRVPDVVDRRDVLESRREIDIRREIIDSRLDSRRDSRNSSRDRDILLSSRERERVMEDSIHKLREQIRLRERDLDEQLVDLRKAEKCYDDSLLQETHCLRAVDDVQAQIAELERKLEDRRKFLKEAQQDVSLRSVRVKDIRGKQSKLQVDVDLLKKDLSTLLDRRDDFDGSFGISSRLRDHGPYSRKSSPPPAYYSDDRSSRGTVTAAERSRTPPDHLLERSISSSGGTRRPPPRDYRDQEIDRYDPRDGPLRTEVYGPEFRNPRNGISTPRESRSRTHTENYMLYPSAHAAAVASPTTDSYIPERDSTTRRPDVRDGAGGRDARDTLKDPSDDDRRNPKPRPPPHTSAGQDIDRYEPYYDKSARPGVAPPVDPPPAGRSSNLAAIDRYEPPPPHKDTYFPPYSVANRDSHGLERPLPPARRDEMLDRPLSNTKGGYHQSNRNQRSNNITRDSEGRKSPVIVERGSNVSSAKSSRNHTPNPTPPRNGAACGNNSKATTPSHQSMPAIEVVERVTSSPNNRNNSNQPAVTVHIQEKASRIDSPNNTSSGSKANGAGVASAFANSSSSIVAPPTRSPIHATTQQVLSSAEQDNQASASSEACANCTDNKRPAETSLDACVKKQRSEGQPTV